MARAKYVPDEFQLPPSSIRVCATAALSKKESENAAKLLKTAFGRVFGRRK